MGNSMALKIVSLVCCLFLGIPIVEAELLYNLEYRAGEKIPPEKSNYWLNLAQKISGFSPEKKWPKDSLWEADSRIKRSGWTGKSSISFMDKISEPKAIITIESEPKLIHGIEVMNPSPLFEDEILDAISIKAGDVFDLNKLREEKTSLTSYLLEEGVICDSIAVEVVEEKPSDNLNLKFQLLNSRVFHIKHFALKGTGWWKRFITVNKLMGFQRALPMLTGRRFRVKALEKEERALKEYFLEKGFYDVQLESEIKLDSLKMEAHININVLAGKKYNVEFLGNDAIGKRKLKKQLAFSRGNKRNVGYKKSLNQIADYYSQHGFLKAKVKGSIDSTTQIKKIKFVIEEGPQYEINKVELEGVEPEVKAEIEKRLLFKKGPFHPSIPYEEKIRISSYLFENGNVSPQIDTHYVYSELLEKKQIVPVSIKYLVSKGRQERIAEISYPALKTEQEKILHKYGEFPLLQKPFNYKELTSAQNEISIKFSELGYPHNVIAFEKSYLEDSSQVKINWKVELGPRVYFSGLFLKGNFNTRQKVLNRELEMTSGDVFSLVKTLESQRNWQNLGLFNNIQLNTLGLLEKRDSVFLMLSVEERKTHYLKLKLGYESDRGGFLESQLGNENLWGLNKHGWLHGKITHREIDEIKWDEFGWGSEVGVSDPAFLGYSLYSSMIVGYERSLEVGSDFFRENFYTSLNFHKSLYKYFEMGIGNEYELRRAEGVTRNISNDEYRNNILVEPYIKFDNRNSFIRPRRGFFTRFGVDVSKNLDGVDKDNFVRYNWLGKAFYTPIPFLTFAAELSSIIINDTNLIEDQRAYLGGSSSVRGYLKNGLDPNGGNIALAGALEVRWEFYKNLESVLFMDAGYMDMTEKPYSSFKNNLGDIKWTPGVGLCYITPIGPIGIHYGHRIQPWGYGAWHFVLGYSI